MYHSEFLQDKWLFENVFPDKRDGIFAEAGALDGLLHSNTLFLERERGWTGLLVEANPEIYLTLKLNRPHCRHLNCALWSHATEMDFLRIDGGLYGWSGLSAALAPEHRARIVSNVSPLNRRRVTVETMTLTEALGGLDHVDYLSLDIEGAEFAVLEAYDWSVPIDVIGVEVNWPRPELAELLQARGYRHLGRVGVDEFWRRSH